MDIRPLGPEGPDRLRAIDRRERIAEVYRVREGRLELHAEACDVPGFDPAELEMLVARQRRIQAGGGVVLGALEGDRLMGIASVEARLRGAERDRVKLDVLYVNQADRGRGVGRALLVRGAEVARALGARWLVVSATPTRATVDFYLRCGARLAQAPDPELAALEPDDVQLELPLTP